MWNRLKRNSLVIWLTQLTLESNERRQIWNEKNNSITVKPCQSWRSGCGIVGESILLCKQTSVLWDQCLFVHVKLMFQIVPPTLKCVAQCCCIFPLSALTVREPSWMSAMWTRSLFPKGANRAASWNSCCSSLRCPNDGPVESQSSRHVANWKLERRYGILYDFHAQPLCMTLEKEQAFKHVSHLLGKYLAIAIHTRTRSGTAAPCKSLLKPNNYTDVV